MNKLKLKLKTFLLDTFGKSKVKVASNGNGINIFADVSAHEDTIVHMSDSCGLSAVVTPKITNQQTGVVTQQAKCWIGVTKDSDMSDDDYLNAL